MNFRQMLTTNVASSFCCSSHVDLYQNTCFSSSGMSNFLFASDQEISTKFSGQLLN